MLVMVNALTASISNAQSVPVPSGDNARLAKNDTSHPVIIEPHKEEQAPIVAEIPFRTQEEKKNAHQRRMIHYFIHTTLESELEDLLDVGFDESMVTHEDVALVQKCIGKPAMKHFTSCLTSAEEREKASKRGMEKTQPQHVIETIKNSVNSTEQVLPSTIPSNKNARQDDQFAVFLEPAVEKCLLRSESKRVALCVEDQMFKIIEKNLNLIEDLDEFGTDYDNLDDLEELKELEELEELEKLKRLEELHRYNHQYGHHHGSSHHHHALHGRHHHIFHDASRNEQERELEELGLLNMSFKPTKSTLPMAEHLRRDGTQDGKNHMILEKRKFGYGPDWQTLVGKRDAHPLP